MESKQPKTFKSLLALLSDTKGVITSLVGTSHSSNLNIRCQTSLKKVISLAKVIDHTELANTKVHRVTSQQSTQKGLYQTGTQTKKEKASSFLSAESQTINSEKEGFSESRKHLITDDTVSENLVKESIRKTSSQGSFKNIKNEIKLLKSHPLSGRSGKTSRATVRPNLDLLRNVVLGKPGSTPFARRKAEVKRRSSAQAKPAIRLFSPSTPDMIARAKRPQLFLGPIRGAKRPRLLELD